jgi:hypothetical protein
MKPTKFEGWKAEELSNDWVRLTLEPAELNQTISVSPEAARVAIHLNDEQGIDRGILDEALITKLGKDS